MSAEMWVDVKKTPITIHAGPVQPTAPSHIFPSPQFGVIEILEGISNEGVTI